MIDVRQKMKIFRRYFARGMELQRAGWSVGSEYGMELSEPKDVLQFQRVACLGF